MINIDDINDEFTCFNLIGQYLYIFTKNGALY
jgi:hypothetical protein